MRLLLAALTALLVFPAAAAAQIPGTPGACEIGDRSQFCEFWTGKVTFIGDGDTLSVDLAGDDTKKPVRVRITGIDTMEEWYYTDNPNERTGECHANDATARLEQLVKRSRKRVRLSAMNPGSTSRGRLKRAVQVKINGTWRDIGTQMLKGGHAIWIASRGEWAWNESYSVTAQRAATRRLGIWNPDYCSPGPHDSSLIKVWANPDPEGRGEKEAGREWIRIKNLDPVNTVGLGGWWVRDSGLRRYVFPSWTLLGPGQTMTVHVGAGVNTATDSFWGLTKPILDNVSTSRRTGDGAYLYDDQGDLRAHSVWPCRYQCTDPNSGAIELQAAYQRRDEFVALRNVSAAPVDLEGYRLFSRPYSYAFGPDSVVQPGETMRVNVKGDPVADTRLEKHWGKTRGILANNGDRVILESLSYIRIGLHRLGQPGMLSGVRLVADAVYQLQGTPPNAINVYLVDDVLVDAGTRLAGRRILRQLRGRAVRAHALTHAHPDHFGSSHAVCEALGVPLWCGENDVEAAETGAVPRRDDSPLAPLLDRLPAPDGHPVERRLREGDDVAGFTVLDVPGHSPGHVALWREADRTLICGDVFFNLPRLGPPPNGLTFDPARNRESMRRLAELEPALVLFGHGPPLRDARRFAQAA